MGMFGAISNYKPTIEDRLAWGTQDILQRMGMNQRTANSYGQKVRGAVGWLPWVGDAIGMEQGIRDARAAAQRGDTLGRLKGSAMFGLNALPYAGKAMMGAKAAAPALAMAIPLALRRHAIDLYHGAKRPIIGSLIPSVTGEFGPGFYATTHPAEASAYAGVRDGANVLKLRAIIKNPLTVKTPDDFWNRFGGGSDEDAVKRAIAAGYDAVKYDRPLSYWDDSLKKIVDTGETQTHYNIFNPENIYDLNEEKFGGRR